MAISHLRWASVNDHQLSCCLSVTILSSKAMPLPHLFWKYSVRCNHLFSYLGSVKHLPITKEEVRRKTRPVTRQHQRLYACVAQRLRYMDIFSPMLWIVALCADDPTSIVA